MTALEQRELSDKQARIAASKLLQPWSVGLPAQSSASPSQTGATIPLAGQAGRGDSRARRAPVTADGRHAAAPLPLSVAPPEISQARARSPSQREYVASRAETSLSP
jgi:hypothetical protein